MGSAIEQYKRGTGLKVDTVHNQRAVRRVKQGAYRVFGNPNSQAARRERRLQREEKMFERQLDIAAGRMSVRDDLFFGENIMSEAQETVIDEFIKEIKTGIRRSDKY